MSALTSIWNSEKGLMAVAIIVGSIVLAALGHMPIDQWAGFVELIFITYVGGKTLQGGAQAIASALRPPELPVAPVTPTSTIATATATTEAPSNA